MPIYEYACGRCGGFTALRTIDERDQPQRCPACAGASVRIVSTPAAFSGLSAALRKAHTVNERAAHEPRKLSAATGSASSGGLSITRSSHGRPWMIGH